MEAILLTHNSDEGAFLRHALQRLGMSVKVTTDFDEMVSNWSNYTADIILLSFPKREIPLKSIRLLRTNTVVSMVVICEQLTEDTHVGLLDAGIDLVVYRPYSGRVLMAQIRAIIRRSSGMPIFNMPVLARGSVRLDPSDRSVYVEQNEPTRLTQLEFRLVFTLMTNFGQVMSTERLVEHIWGYSGRGDRDLVRGLIRRLRAKIEPEPRKPQFIITVPGVGYTFKA